MRTDLAIEMRESAGESCPGVVSQTIDIDNTRVTRISITTEEGAAKLARPIGEYVTVELPPFSAAANTDDERRSTITAELIRLLPENGCILVAGLGNLEITPDALGPKTAEKIFATRHIPEELAHALGLSELRPVAALTPGVSGKTGIETAEILASAVDRIKPAAVIVIDALASRSLSRLGSTVQLSDTGIVPGSGVGNSRSEISKDTLGVPVIAMGVPTVVDATTLAGDLLGSENAPALSPGSSEMMVTPREIDSVIVHAADLLALAINCALHKNLTAQDLILLT